MKRERERERDGNREDSKRERKVGVCVKRVASRRGCEEREERGRRRRGRRVGNRLVVVVRDGEK